jgi:hypothetical protein
MKHLLLLDSGWAGLGSCFPPCPQKYDSPNQTHPLFPQVPTFALPPQPYREGAWRLQDGLPVGRSLHDTLTEMMTVINRAAATLPDLTPHRRRRRGARRR